VSVALALAWRQRGTSWGAPFAVIGGAAVPIAAVLLYFARHDALRALYDGAILFNLLHLERPPHSLGDHLRGPARVVVAAFPGLALPIALGLVAPLALLALRRRR